MLIELTRKELKNKGASMYAEGTVIKCGRYYIHITYENGKMMTTVSTVDSIADLPMSKHPQYIRDFIDDSNLETRDFNYKIGEKIHHIDYNNQINTDRIDIITDITYNSWGDMVYNTKEINAKKGERVKRGQVYERWITRAN